MNLKAGTKIGPYEIQAALGAGGMGIVYRARDERLGREVALKFLADPLTRDPSAVERFTREVRAASALNHPNIVTVYDVGESDAGRFVAMELVSGRTLREVVNRRPSLAEAARIGEQTARALTVAHAAGIVHRDIKPENVMVRDDGYVKVLDFGLARLLPHHLTASAVLTLPATEVGTCVGTAQYMSPEQARGDPVDPATDIFSLGLVMYELVTGHHPFAADTSFGLVHNILTQHPRAPSGVTPKTPAALDTLILEMLDKDPQRRPTAGAVAENLASVACVPVTVAPARPSRAKPHTVGREHELSELNAAFEHTTSGTGLLISVAGEPGIGKTTLVEVFLDHLFASGEPCHIARGRCSERLAGTEAYLPILEALDSLLNSGSSDSVARMMRDVAPTWYTHVAPSTIATAVQTAPAIQAGSQERLKRELAAFVHEIARQRPVALFLDDVHWADASTIDMLAYLATKFDRTRLLVVAAYRPSELLVSKHPFLSVKLDLETRGFGQELLVRFLAPEDIECYVALEFPDHAFPSTLAVLIHARTEGSPLFVVDVLRYLRDRNVIVSDEGNWKLARAVPDIERELPTSIRSMIQRKIDQLGEVDHRLLATASVQGYEFNSAVVAKVLSMDVADVEERLDSLDRVHGFVQRAMEQEFPDQTLTLRYRFVHVLYQNALMSTLTPTRKASISGAVALALERYYGGQAAGIANELAVLFEGSRDFQRAADHLLLAAQNAARVFAHHETVRLSRHGLELLKRLPVTPERDRLELEFLTTLGLALLVTQGFGAAEVQGVYARARDLCRQRGETPELFRVLWGLWWFYEVRAEFETAQALADQLLALAEHAQDPILLVQAHRAPAQTLFWLGELGEARRHMELGLGLYDPRAHAALVSIYGQDPGVAYRCFFNWVLWLQGYPDQALCITEEALARSLALSHPFTRAIALTHAAIFHQHCRELQQTLERAEETVAFCTEQGFPFFRAVGLILRGWAQVELGRTGEGIATMFEGVPAYRNTGAAADCSHYLGMLAEALGNAGQANQGLDTVDEALAFVDRTGERFYEAELYRLKGHLLGQLADTDDGGRATALTEIEPYYRRAISIARRQRAKSLELRAVTSLTRLLARTSRRIEARQLLADIYGWFTEGFDTAGLREAKALLDELS